MITNMPKFHVFHKWKGPRGYVPYPSFALVGLFFRLSLHSLRPLLLTPLLGTRTPSLLPRNMISHFRVDGNGYVDGQTAGCHTCTTVHVVLIVNVLNLYGWMIEEPLNQPEESALGTCITKEVGMILLPTIHLPCYQSAQRIVLHVDMIFQQTFATNQHSEEWQVD